MSIQHVGGVTYISNGDAIFVQLYVKYMYSASCIIVGGRDIRHIYVYISSIQAHLINGICD